MWALASVLVEQTGGYSKQAWEHAALWVNMSQGQRFVWSFGQLEGLDGMQSQRWGQNIIYAESDAMLMMTKEKLSWAKEKRNAFHHNLIFLDLSFYLNWLSD